MSNISVVGMKNSKPVPAEPPAEHSICQVLILEERNESLKMYSLLIALQEPSFLFFPCCCSKSLHECKMPTVLGTWHNLKEFIRWLKQMYWMKLIVSERISSVTGLGWIDEFTGIEQGRQIRIKYLVVVRYPGTNDQFTLNSCLVTGKWVASSASYPL